MDVLSVDVGGTHVKLLATGQDEPRKFVSGPKLTPQQMVTQVRKLAQGWTYQASSIGYPGVVTPTGRSRNRTIWRAVGWLSISKRRSACR